jgi:hypothetical protein
MDNWCIPDRYLNDKVSREEYAKKIGADVKYIEIVAYVRHPEWSDEERIDKLDLPWSKELPFNQDDFSRGEIVAEATSQLSDN